MARERSLRPSFDVNWRPTLLGAATLLAVLLPGLLRLEIRREVYLGGLLAGFVAGVLTDRYGNAMSNGLLAGALGGAAACVVLFAYGSYASWRLGFGFDSVFAAQYGFRAIALFVLAVPIHAVEGALAALLANGLRVRLLDRFASGG
ncbi:hypothetical protein [Natronomonas gomsonensis]|uniref:hypothetical protein n=1 Tax=Natronomonas gomsonensis TaxID=1046043 RepID=UPI0015BD01EB|nr:hypothetical protein [Natronomonas gomsonensis]